MTNHSHTAPRSIERHCDVAVVGGSAAGLAAALQLGRQRRSVIVIDAGDPRNAPAAHMHSYLGYDGRPPSELVAVGREEVRSYGGEILAGRVEQVARRDDGFRLELTGGHTVVARRVLAATGITDVLPDIEGLAEHWGVDAIHCPFCHGYEARDQRLVAILTSPMGLHPLGPFRHLARQLTVVVHDPAGIDESALAKLREDGATVMTAPAARVHSGADGRLHSVELADGNTLDADAVVIGPRFRPRLEAFVALGLAATPHASGLGDVVAVDETGATPVPGLFAAGNLTDPGQQVLQAGAHGGRVGAMIAFSLLADDTAQTANAADWDARYSGGQMWSGNPNGTLVDQVSELAPGRALDVGAGEGGDAVWLAERGWQVTASDVSQVALDRIAAESERRSLSVACHLADANARDPFPVAAFDLVSAQYASIPRTPDGRAVTNLLDAVAPGGTLLVVGHDLEPMRRAIDTATHSQAFDPDAYVRVSDFATALSGSPDWQVELHELRPRPAGAASGHHLDDEVLRARRR